MNRRVKRILLYLAALAMVLTMLPGAAADGIQAKKADSIYYNVPIYMLATMEQQLDLPDGSKPVNKIIPLRCVTVRQNDVVTIPVVVSPATMFSLNDLIVRFDMNMLLPIPPDIRTMTVKGNRATIKLKFRAVGKPTDTTRVSYFSRTRASSKSRTYVTIVPQPVTGVRLDPTSATMHVGDPALQLNATVLPDKATNKSVRWYSTNPKVASVSSTGLVTARKIGKATIYVVTKSGGKRAKCRITVAEAPFA
jgi:uncharacterized protein YjdB